MNALQQRWSDDQRLPVYYRLQHRLDWREGGVPVSPRPYSEVITHHQSVQEHGGGVSRQVFSSETRLRLALLSVATVGTAANIKQNPIQGTFGGSKSRILRRGLHILSTLSKANIG